VDHQVEVGFSDWFETRFTGTKSGSSHLLQVLMSTKLFVGGLSFNTTENDIQSAFAEHGSVSEVNVIMDRMTGKSKGFAFVTMGSPQEAQTAITAMNGKVLDGRNLTVNEARPREERTGGGGGGGRRDRY
jgi:cold-inducible RNA-binding protein